MSDTTAKALQNTNQTPASSFDHLPGLSGQKIVIAIDGPSASGKGTLAKNMAERLGYAYLDTGSLYRAVAFTALEMQADPKNTSEIMMAMSVIQKNITPELLARPELRTEHISAMASEIAAIPEVRKALLNYQKDFSTRPPGNVGGAVLDGRDIGTTICPDAHVKIFVTAQVEERARRRFEDVKNAGISYEQVLADLKERDARDQNRSVSPTRAAEDAYILDTSHLSPAQVLDEAIAIIRAKFISMANDSI